MTYRIRGLGRTGDNEFVVVFAVVELSVRVSMHFAGYATK